MAKEQIVATPSSDTAMILDVSPRVPSRCAGSDLVHLAWRTLPCPTEIIVVVSPPFVTSPDAPI